MALSFANPRRFDDDDRQLLRALADQCAQALERALLYEAEQRLVPRLSKPSRALRGYSSSRPNSQRRSLQRKSLRWS